MKYQRARFHNYRLPGIYHFTLMQNPGFMPFAHIKGSSAAPVTELTDMGMFARSQLSKVLGALPGVIYGPVAYMPDHLHVVVTVQQPLERSIRSELAAFKSQCTKEHARLTGSTPVGMFVNNMHDRIVFDDRQLEACRNYVHDNPRRLLVQREHPDLFRVYNHLRIGDREMAAYGNLFLLRDFQKKAVRIHRRWTDSELALYTDECLSVTANGGVLVSPWIHPWERDIRDRALAMGGRIITLRADGFRDRFKPSGNEFSLCRQGRLLLLAPWPDRTADAVTRGLALELNELAVEMADVGPETVLRLVL